MNAQRGGLLAIPGDRWFSARAHRAHYRWATRDHAPYSDRRTLWRRKPAILKPGPYHGIYEKAREGTYQNKCMCLYFTRDATREEFRDRFGRDLCPGELRPLAPMCRR